MTKPWSDERIKPEKVKEFPRRHANLTSTATGYGERIPTRKMAYVEKRWHRIYCTIHSNVGTVYIEKAGKRHLLDHPDL